MNMTRYYFILSLLFCHSLLASDSRDNLFVEEPLSLNEHEGLLGAVGGEPSSIIHNAVNVISGDFVDFEKDIQMPGIEPLAIQRYYSSSDYRRWQCYRAWKFNHDIAISRSYQYTTEEEDRLYWQDAHGMRIPFETFSYSYKNTHSLSVNPHVLHKRITNTSSGLISGKTHLKNRLLVNTPIDRKLLAYDGSGNEYHFGRMHNHRDKGIETLRKLNGHSLSYSYDEEERISGVKALNSKGGLLGQLQLSYQKIDSRHMNMKVNADNRSEAIYHLEQDRKSQQWRLLEVERNEAPFVKYKYSEKYEKHPDKIISKQFPDQRYLNIQYYQTSLKEVQREVKKEAQSKKNKDHEHLERNRVKQLEAPAGTDGRAATC